MSHVVVLWKFPEGSTAWGRGENIKNNSGRRQNEKVWYHLEGAGNKGEAKIFQIWLNWVHLGRGCLQWHLLLKLQAPVVS